MKKMDRLVNLIKIAILNKKVLIKIKFNKKEIKLLKVLLKINIILFIKKITNNTALLKINNTFTLKIKSFFKKKKISINGQTNNIKNITIISNSEGLSILNKNGGLLMWNITF